MRSVPESANRRDWPRLVARAINKLVVTSQAVVPVGGLTGQVLAKASAADNDCEWAFASGASSYASFYLGTGGVTGVSNTATTLAINQTGVNSDGAIFSLAADEVTINKTADFKIDAQCYFNTGGTSRSEFTMWLEIDGTEVPGSRTGTYQRGYDSGDTASLSLIVAITSGEVIRLRIQRTDGGATTGYQDDNGTRLTIEEK